MAGFRIDRNIHAAPTPKAKAVKDKGYLSFIHELPCIVSGRIGVEAAHISFANPIYCHYGRGRGTKASDAWCIPLRADFHAKQHSGSEREFWHEIGIDPHATAAALWMAYSTLGDEAVRFATARIMMGINEAEDYE